MKKIRNFVTILCSIALLCGTVSTAAAVETIPSNPVVVVTNNETGEREVIELNRVVEDGIMTVNEENDCAVTYSAFVSLPEPESEIQPASEIVGGKNENGVRVTVTVVYEISSDHEQIKIKQIYGGWEPSSSLYLVTNREVGLNNFVADTEMVKYPTSNTFSYYTGWDYENFVVGVNGAPFAWADALIRIIDMTATYSLVYGFNFPDER